MADHSREILCPISGKIIQQNHGIKGSSSRFLSEFEEIEVLGKGGFGVVVKCLCDGMIFAVKKIDVQQTEMSLEEVRREAEILKKMEHPNIIKCYDYWEEERICGHYYDSDDHLCTHKACFYIKMEFCQNKLSSYPLIVEIDMERRLDFIRQLVDAVSYMHNLGIIHRDLSRENILLDEKLNIKIIDFGLAVEAGEMGHDQSNSHGIHYYKAPELRKGKTIDSKVDIFSLGVWFYEILKNLKTDDDRTLQLDNLHHLGLSWEDFLDLGLHAPLIKDMLAHDPSQRPSALLIQEMMPWSDRFKYISVADEQAAAAAQAVADEEEMALE